jgi:hypothetical protein
MNTNRRQAGIVGVAIVFIVTISPVLLVAWAGASGSVGDLGQVEILPVGVALAILLAVAAGIATSRAFARVDADPTKGTLDGWAAFVLGLGAYILILTLIPIVITEMMLPGETESFDDRLFWIGLVYVGGHVLAVVVGMWTGSAFLGRGGDAGGNEAEQAESITTRVT